MISEEKCNKWRKKSLVEEKGVRGKNQRGQKKEGTEKRGKR